MRRDIDRTRFFTRRALVVGGAQLGLFGALITRMYYLQVIESEKYKTLADENRINLRLLVPPRGRILDRYGELLATNQLNYRVIVIPEQTGSVPATLEALSQLLSLNETDHRRILREVARKRRFLQVTVRENLSWEDVARVAVNAQDLPGVAIDVGATRHYPDGPSLAHIVGYVAPPSEADLTGDPLLEQPDFRVGRAGVERVYDLALRGRAGTSQVEVNAVGRPIRELDRVEGKPGLDLWLTIDQQLQIYATERIAKEESGAAVVMDVHTGEVLALASNPNFDPNEFNKGIGAQLWRSLVTNDRSPLSNKAIAGQYAPGSTFKMITALAALEGGVLTPDFRVSCPGHFELGDAKFHCWKKGGHGSLAMLDAITQSCDVYFYEVARRLGIDRIAQMARRFGLGKPVAIDLPNERGGLIPTRDWKIATTGTAWAQGETVVVGIGQGFVLATPLQLATVAARIANGGYAVVPRVTRDVVEGRHATERSAPKFASIGISAPSLSLIQRGMRNVVNDPRGTAYRARIGEPEFAMAGKTGTSQVRRISEEERRVGLRKPNQVPWSERDHALFICFAPVIEPRYACAVVIEHGGGGSAVAAPIARDILREAQRRAREMPLPGTRIAVAGASSPERTASDRRANR